GAGSSGRYGGGGLTTTEEAGIGAGAAVGAGVIYLALGGGKKKHHGGGGGGSKGGGGGSSLSSLVSPGSLTPEPATPASLRGGAAGASSASSEPGTPKLEDRTLPISELRLVPHDRTELDAGEQTSFSLEARSPATGRWYDV